MSESICNEVGHFYRAGLCVACGEWVGQHGKPKAAEHPNPWTPKHLSTTLKAFQPGRNR